jgi:hypothetical protein
MAMVSGKVTTGETQRHVAMAYRQMGDFDHNGVLQICEIKKQKRFSAPANSVFAGCSKKRFFSL